MGDRDARHQFESLAQHGGHRVHAQAAVLAVHQTDIDAGVHLALGIGGVDGGQGIAHFRKLANDAIDLACARFGDLNRRPDWCVEIQRCFREIGLWHKFGSQQGHHQYTADKDGGRQSQRGEFVPQRPAQNALVKVDQPVGGMIKPERHPADGFVVQRDRGMVLAVGFNAGVVPDAGEHRIEREADKH